MYTDEEIDEMTPEEAQKGIEKLHDLRNQCVGTLYPSIISGVIEKLMIRKYGGKIKPKPPKERRIDWE